MNPESKRPPKLDTFTEIVKTGCGTAYLISTAYKPGEYFEITGILGKSGNCSAAQMNGLSVMINHYVNQGGNPKTAAKSLSSIECPQNSRFLRSCAQAFAFVLTQAVQLGKEEKT